WFEDRAELDGAVAVVTGGGGGLGEAIVGDRSASGGRMATVDIDPTGVERVAALPDTIAMVGDARDPEVLAELFAAVDERWGRVDTLVNVVGGTFRAEFTDTTPKGWDALVRTNFTHVLH